MRAFPRAAVIILGVLAFGATALAQEPGKRRTLGTPAQPYQVRPATSDIKIDGVMDEQAWKDAVLITLDYEWFPGDGIKPPVDTDVRITYNARNLYVGFYCYDPEPEKIRAHLMDRDRVNTFVQDDHVLFMVDPFNDERRGFQFRVNPFGVQMDAIFSEIEGIEDFAWNIIWNSAGRIVDDGYVVEIAIPLNQIRFPAGSGVQTWGFDLGRSYPRNVRHRIQSNYRDRNINCVLCQADKVEGFENLKPGKNIELDPTLTGLRREVIDAFPDGELQEVESELEPGLTGRWNVTADMTLNAAINPDFSQVEADVLQLDANERFAIRYPETRPFFLEGIDIFSTPIEALFTRTIRDPQWGLKFTGKVGGNAFGVFAAKDETPPGIIVPFNQLSGGFLLPEGEKVNTGVVRYRRDVGKTSTLGVLYTDREGNDTDYRNRVGGVDGYLRINNRNEVRFQYLRSDTLYPEGSGAANWNQVEGESFDDHAFAVDWNYSSRNWFATIEYDDRGEGFRADAGFVPRANLRRAFGFGRYRTWGERGDWYVSTDVGTWMARSEFQDGTLSGKSIGVLSNVRGPLQSFVELSLEYFTELNSLEELDIDRSTLYENLLRSELFFTLQPSGSWQIQSYIRYGDGIDYALDVPATEFLANPSIELKAGRHLNLWVNHFLLQLDDEATGARLLEANTTELRAVWQFSVRTFVRAIVQRDARSRRSAPDATPVDTEGVFTQLLFSYMVNPQTRIYVGLEESRADNFFDPNADPPRTVFSDDLVPTNRFYFVKLGYAFLF
jgi:hypothetical protein